MNKRYFKNNIGQLIIVDEVNNLLAPMDKVDGVTFEDLENTDLTDWTECVRLDEIENEFEGYEENYEMDEEEVREWLGEF